MSDSVNLIAAIKQADLGRAESNLRAPGEPSNPRDLPKPPVRGRREATLLGAPLRRLSNLV